MSAGPAVTPPSSAPAPSVGDAGTGHAHFGRLLLSEWTKLRSVRSTYWSLIALIIAFPFFCWLFPYLTVNQWSSAHPDRKATVLADPVGTVMVGGMFLAQFAVAVLGAMVTTSEYSTGMIRSTLLASPHRVRMLAAKSIVFTVLVFVIGEAIAFLGFYIGKATYRNLLVVQLNGGDLREVFGVGLYLAGLALFSMVIGALLHHMAGAIFAVVALLLVVGNLISLVPGKLGDYLYTYDPTNAGYAILGSHLPTNFLLTPWQGFTVFCVWIAALWALAAWLLVRRDA